MTDQIHPVYQIPTAGPADPILQELLPEFLDAWIKDLSTTWADICARGDVQELHRFGHTIKGSFIQFGFRDLSGVGKEIMEDADRAHWSQASARIAALLLVVNTMRAQSSSQPNH